MKEKQNPYKSHVLVLPEDRANEQIVNGFNNFLDIYSRAIQIERPAGGWEKVVDKFKENISDMKKFPKRMIVLLIDFDEDYENRFSYVKEQIPDYLENRVFVLGVLSEPEKLRSNLGNNFECIGENLAKDCSNNTTNELWGHDLLKHNKTELDRMILSVKPFLFN